MPEKPYKLCYPCLGNYDIAIQYFVNHGAHLEYISPPAMTKRTIELGAKYSPDFVCAPFKSHMGNYIEALEAGANVLIQTGGTCRLGYYGELHEQILKDMGYDFEMLNLTLFNYNSLPALIRGMKRYATDANLLQIAAALPATLSMVLVIDKVEDYYRQNMGFEITKGSFDKVYNRFLANLRKTKGLRRINRIYKQTMEDFKAIPIDKPEHPLRVGVVGEYFTIMDPFSNHEVEKKLAQMGTEVHRWMNLSNSLLICPDKRTIRKLYHYLHYDMNRFPSSIWVDIQKKDSPKYASNDTGSSSVSTITLAEHYAKEGFDGLVHIKSFGCTPEMDCIPMLHNISADYKIPTLFLSYDTQTSDTGIETRLEAFYDMIAMRRHSDG
ncbi:MAG: hypothetical protein LIO96_06025 [Lachnospiraceae bacterium]|nr:hypothetical protein [Lachnospiraceae bacterium]